MTVQSRATNPTSGPVSSLLRGVEPGRGERQRRHRKWREQSPAEGSPGEPEHPQGAGQRRRGDRHAGREIATALRRFPRSRTIRSTQRVSSSLRATLRPPRRRRVGAHERSPRGHHRGASGRSASGAPSSFEPESGAWYAAAASTAAIPPRRRAGAGRSAARTRRRDGAPLRSPERSGPATDPKR
jgi:hypothetical protein